MMIVTVRCCKRTITPFLREISRTIGDGLELVGKTSKLPLRLAPIIFLHIRRGQQQHDYNFRSNWVKYSGGHTNITFLKTEPKFLGL
jgi:hypothetical protein